MEGAEILRCIAHFFEHLWNVQFNMKVLGENEKYKQILQEYTAKAKEKKKKTQSKLHRK